jgi:hypothetical protein
MRQQYLPEFTGYKPDRNEHCLVRLNRLGRPDSERKQLRDVLFDITRNTGIYPYISFNQAAIEYCDWVG